MFIDPIKVHITPDPPQSPKFIHVAFRVSDCYAKNFVFDLKDFLKLITANEKLEIIQGPNTWQILPKKDYVKLWYKRGYEDHHFRFTHEQIKELQAVICDKLLSRIQLPT